MTLTRLADGTCLNISDSFLEMLGLRREEVVGRKVAELGVWVSLDEREKIVAEIKSGRPVSGRQVEILSKDGVTRICIFFARQVDFDGAKCMLSEAIDVTELKETEKKLKESEKRIEVLLENVPIGIQGYGVDGTVFYWNGASERIYGYKAEEALGKNLGDLIIPPEIKPLFESGLATAAGITESGEYLPAGDVSLLRKDGSRVVVHSIHTVVCASGKPPTLFCMDIDLSDRIKMEGELRESEAQLGAFFENSVFAVADHELVLGEDGRPMDYIFIKANKAFEEHTGLERSKVLGKRVTEVLPGIEASKFISVYGKVAMTGEPVTLDMYSEPLKRHYIISAFQTGLNRFATIFHDVTERRKSDDILKAKVAESERLNRFMMGREMRLIELKREINEILKQFGQPPRYTV